MSGCKTEIPLHGNNPRIAHPSHNVNGEQSWRAGIVSITIGRANLGPVIGYLFVDYSSIYDMNMVRDEINLTDVRALSDVVTTTDPQSITVYVNRHW